MSASAARRRGQNGLVWTVSDARCRRRAKPLDCSSIVDGQPLRMTAMRYCRHGTAFLLSTSALPAVYSGTVVPVAESVVAAAGTRPACLCPRALLCAPASFAAGQRMGKRQAAPRGVLLGRSSYQGTQRQGELVEAAMYPGTVIVSSGGQTIPCLRGLSAIARVSATILPRPDETFLRNSTHGRSCGDQTDLDRRLEYS
jgi:hypothetical protein